MKRGVVVVLFAALIVILLAGCSQPAPSASPAAKPAPAPTSAPAPKPTTAAPAATVKPVEIKFATAWYGEGSAYFTQMKAFAERVNQGAGGKVKIILYPNEALVPSKEIFSSVSMGTIDMGAIWSNYFEAKFPIAGVFGIMYTANLDFPKAEKETRAILAPLYEKQSIKYLGDTGMTYYGVASNFEVKTMADFKGKLIRVPGGYSKLSSEALGGTSVTMSQADTPMALQRKTVDATWASPDTAFALGLADITKYFVQDWDCANTGFEIMLNLNVWKKIPADAQKVIEDSMNKMVEDDIKARLAADQAAFDKLTKAGVQTSLLSAEESKRWKEAIKPIGDVFVQKAGDPTAAKALLTALLKYQK